MTLCGPMDCSLPGTSVHGILQPRTLEWVAMPSARGSSQPRDPIHVSCFADKFFSTEPPGKPILNGITPLYINKTNTGGDHTPV